MSERVAVLRGLKELLSEQRAKFREYLTVLEKQETSIASEDMEKLYAHTELEQNILGNISNLQKVIKPMEALYKDAPALPHDLRHSRYIPQKTAQKQSLHHPDLL